MPHLVCAIALYRPATLNALCLSWHQTPRSFAPFFAHGSACDLEGSREFQRMLSASVLSRQLGSEAASESKLLNPWLLRERKDWMKGERLQVWVWAIEPEHFLTQLQVSDSADQPQLFRTIQTSVNVFWLDRTIPKMFFLDCWRQTIFGTTAFAQCAWHKPRARGLAMLARELGHAKDPPLSHYFSVDLLACQRFAVLPAAAALQKICEASLRFVDVLLELNRAVIALHCGWDCALRCCAFGRELLPTLRSEQQHSKATAFIRLIICPTLQRHAATRAAPPTVRHRKPRGRQEKKHKQRSQGQGETRRGFGGWGADTHPTGGKRVTQSCRKGTEEKADSVIHVTCFKIDIFLLWKAIVTKKVDRAACRRRPFRITQKWLCEPASFQTSLN